MTRISDSEDINSRAAIYRGQYVGSNCQCADSGTPPSRELLGRLEDAQKRGNVRIGQLVRLVTNKACCRVEEVLTNGWIILKSVSDGRKFRVPEFCVAKLPWTAEPRFGVNIWEGAELRLEKGCEGSHV